MVRHYLVSISMLICPLANALEAEDVGLYHTKAFELLGSRYANTGPTSKVDVMSNIADILGSFCEEPELELQLDSNCKKKVYEMTVKGFYKLEKGPQVMDLPVDFDPSLSKSLEMIEPTLNDLDENNYNEVLSTLMEIQNEIIQTEDTNEVQKLIAISGSSIAIESLKLWYGAFTEPKHYLRNFVLPLEERDRDLQTLTLTLDFSIIADVVNADVTNALQAAIDSIALAPFLLIYPPVFPLIALYSGTIASAAVGAGAGRRR